MQSAETVLDVIRERGRKGLPLERLYRQLFNRELFLLAYGRIYSNAGAMTPGVTGETVDGMSLAKIDTIIGALRSETYRWSPARRVYVPKKDGRRRPIGMPPWSDKIVAEVVRLLLEAYYNVRFSDHSHGFRPGRGCHTALREVANTWTGTTWFVEGDLADYFGSLDHEILLSTLAEHIHDGRFLQLIDRMLKAGYLEDWRWNATLSGAPQGGVASPILSNIYLDRFDQWVEQQLIPEYNVGRRRRPNPAYQWANSKIRTATRKGDKGKVGALRRERRSLPSLDPYDPGYRRLRYVRYCDDFLLGFAGPKHEAEEIKEKARAFLRDELRLELSEPKTLITYAASRAARFLGYEIRTQRADTKITRGRRMVNGKIGLFVPRDVIRKRCARYTKHGKPAMRGVLLHDEDFTIVAKYGSEYRGFVQYYLLAQDVYRLGPLHRVMELSLLKTLARKHRSTATKMARKYKAVTMTADGPRACFQVTVQRDRGRKPLTARFGGIPLHQQRTTAIADIKPTMATVWGNELIRRLLAGQCEMCESRVGLQVHHIRKLADLKKPGRSEPSIWVRLMAQRRRKTLVVCATCHHDIHAGRATATTRK
ncbi:reverse transcriptase domain-containing protein [Streptomyces malaysiensis subsp. malaysiensis]|uniref:reverse transcriptase/maturase family protein n=1 Tax=Streptomyces malaysiensis TaxID=92644 RepID=UPI0024BFE0C4|nr:reverse transcriptase/maturase family protein [Streptomyces sp. NA07423]WHX15598.1 reverse transcriptase domain-containing protein [Streptomyces sp. NA07423]